MLLRVVERRMVWLLLSGLFICLGFGLMGVRMIQGDSVLNFGTDFAGGSTLMLRIPAIANSMATASDPSAQSAKEIGRIRSELGELGLANSVIQITRDNELIIKTRALTDDQSRHIHGKLGALYGETEILEFDFIGPSMGG